MSSESSAEFINRFERKIPVDYFELCGNFLMIPFDVAWQGRIVRISNDGELTEREYNNIALRALAALVALLLLPLTLIGIALRIKSPSYNQEYNWIKVPNPAKAVSTNVNRQPIS